MPTRAGPMTFGLKTKRELGVQLNDELRRTPLRWKTLLIRQVVGLPKFKTSYLRGSSSAFA